MQSFQIQLKTITPMYMAGQDFQKFEWRSSSIKGMLRWWFRAAGGSRDMEGWLFGKTFHEPALASGVTVQTKTKIVKPLPYQPTQVSVPKYFAFPFNLKDGQRKGIARGSILEITLQFHPRLCQEDREKILSALWLAVHLGTFGYRCRKGFGSCLPFDTASLRNEWFSSERLMTVDGRNQFKHTIQTHIDRLNEKPQKIRIQNVFHLTSSWTTIESLYKDIRRSLGLPDKVMAGYPIFKGPNILKNISRFASSLWIKPISEKESLLTILRVPDRVKNEIQKISGSQEEPDPEQRFRKMILEKLKSYSVIYPLPK